MPVGSAKFGLMAAAGGGGGFVATGGIIKQYDILNFEQDSSGNGHHGKNVGASFVSSGASGYALDFDGDNDHMKVPIPSTISNNFTVSVWVYWDASASSSDYDYPFAMGIGASGGGENAGGHFSFRRDVSTDYLTIFSGNESHTTSDAMPTGEWVHLLARCYNTTIEVYYNGVSKSLSNTPASVNFDITTEGGGTIGAYHHDLSYGPESDYETHPMNGKIDEVAIWNAGLTQAEAVAIYNSGTPLDLTSDSGNYTSASDLQCYWKMDNALTTKRIRTHAFRGSGKFVVHSGAADVDCVVVGGGGSGGIGRMSSNSPYPVQYGGSGGGGAGAVRTATGYAVSAGDYPVTVGAGGAAATGWPGAGNTGSDSVALGTTAEGGGGGGPYHAVGGDGGSGGGGGCDWAGPSGTPTAYAGGTGDPGGDGGAGRSTGSGPAADGGGGGGAGADGTVGGAHGWTYQGGIGGAGLPSYGLDVIPAFYGGGGTGAGYSNSDGAGATSRNRKSRGYMAGGGVSAGGKDSRGGLANTGGGGGAQGNPSYKSGEGGTGIVVIQYELEVS